MTAPEPTARDRMKAARLVAGNLRRETLQDAIATALAEARADGLHEGRTEQLTDADRRGLAAVYGYELGLSEALRDGGDDRDRGDGNL